MKEIVVKTNYAGPKSTKTKKKTLRSARGEYLIMSALIDKARWRGVLSLIEREAGVQCIPRYENT
jgi:hypothetical protein